MFALARLPVIQSLLFVPGARPDRFAKALASGADGVCIDLEDAVPPDGKVEARGAAFAALAKAPGLAIRINGLRTRAGLADLLALADAQIQPSLLLMPMVDDAAEPAIVRGVLGENCPPLVPLIETVRGLSNAAAIAADPTVALMMFGGADFCAELGVPLTWEATATARSQLVMACAGAGKGAIDVPFIGLDDEAGLAAECRSARAVGFTAKAAIHPAQLGAIHAAFRPSPAEIEEAEAAAVAFAQSGGAAVRFGGRMLEAPIMARFNRILALKERLDA